MVVKVPPMLGESLFENVTERMNHLQYNVYDKKKEKHRIFNISIKIKNLLCSVLKFAEFAINRWKIDVPFYYKLLHLLLLAKSIARYFLSYVYILSGQSESIVALSTKHKNSKIQIASLAKLYKVKENSSDKNYVLLLIKKCVRSKLIFSQYVRNSSPISK